MIDAVIGLDHLLVSVDDVDDAARSLERIGLSLTPTSHITNMGLANRLVLLEPLVATSANFIELMMVEDPDRVPDAMGSLLSSRGPRSTILATTDADATARSLDESGLELGVPQHVRRMWRLPDGEEVWPEFDVILPNSAGLPFNYCQYHNLELYHDRRWRDHPVGAGSLLEVGVRGRLPEPLAHRLAGLSNGVVDRSADTWSVRTPTGASYVVEPADSVDEYAGVVISVASVDAAEQTLIANDVPFTRAHSSLRVAPADSCGIGIEFRHTGLDHADV